MYVSFLQRRYAAALINSQRRKLADTTTTENVYTATRVSAILADYLVGYQKKTYKQASELELVDMRIPSIASDTLEDIHSIN